MKESAPPDYDLTQIYHELYRFDCTSISDSSVFLAKSVGEKSPLTT